jgi:hypothetical protein
LDNSWCFIGRKRQVSHINRPSTSRRAVVAGLAAAAGSAAIATPARALAPRGDSKPRSGFEQWRTLADPHFRVAAESGSCGLSLVAVKAMPSQGARPSRCDRPHAFAAIFDAPAAALAPAGNRTYAVQHPELGTFPLFLGAPGREAGKLRFVAIFN